MISPEDKKSDHGSSQARLAARAAKRREDEVLDVAGMTPQDNGLPPLTAEQARALRMMESENERLRVERLRKQAWERYQEERKYKV